MPKIQIEQRAITEGRTATSNSVVLRAKTRHLFVSHFDQIAKAADVRRWAGQHLDLHKSIRDSWGWEWIGKDSSGFGSD